MELKNVKWKSAQHSYDVKTSDPHSTLANNLHNMVAFGSILRQILANDSGRMVLDVACGNGIIAGMTYKEAGYWYWDDSKELHGCDWLENKHFPGSFVRCNAQSLPYKDNSFDYVTCVFSLDHFINPWMALDEINRVLKPGSYFYWAQGITRKGGAELVKSGHPHHFYDFSITSSLIFLKRQGYEDVSFRPTVENMVIFRGRKGQ